MTLNHGNRRIALFAASALGQGALSQGSRIIADQLIVPAPGVDGRLESVDGRAQTVMSLDELARAINAQAVEPRIDIDHRSEPESLNYQGNTEALGWVQNVRVRDGGGLIADLNILDADLAEAISEDRYRWLSPAFWLEGRDDRVTGLSSLAFTNHPNLQALRVAANTGGDDAGGDDAGGDDAGGDDVRRRDLNRREADVRRLEENHAAGVLDAAVAEGAISRASIPYHRAAIAAHPTLAEGIAAFERAIAPERGLAANLTRRTAPPGAPRARRRMAKAAPTPVGFQAASAASHEMAARIATHARERNISFREAAVEVERLDRG